jgi:hypothetical protein
MAVSLVPVSSEQERASCPNCSAALAPDQRYCLTCGQPVSPVRLEFLDFLAPEPWAAQQGQVQSLPPGYVTVIEPSSGPDGWLRRYSGLFGLLAVLLMSIIVGLLVGHWVTQSKAPSQQVIKVEGLSGATPLAAAASAAPTSTAPASSTSPSAAAASKTEAKAEVAEAKEAKAIEKAPPPKPVKVTATKLQKLGNTTGKAHEEEIAKLGNQPIETGG